MVDQNIVRSSRPFIRAMGGFLNWWTGELSALLPRLPRSLDEALRRRRRWLVAKPTESGISIGWKTVDGFATLAELPLSETGDAPSQGHPRTELPSRRVGVRLPPEKVWRRTLTLPREAERSLRSVLENLLEHETPIRLEHAVFDHRIVSRDPIRRTIEVELAVARRSFVDAIVARIEQAGPRVGAVGLPAVEEWPPTFVLMSASSRSPGVAERRIAVGLVLMTCSLAGLVAYLWFERQTLALTGLRGRIEEVRRDAGQSVALHDELSTLQAQIKFIDDRRAQTNRTAVLAELTDLLPDGSWAVELQLRGVEGVITGYAESASRLIELVSASAILRNVRFRSPVTPGPRPGIERFDIAFQFGGGGT